MASSTPVSLGARRAWLPFVVVSALAAAWVATACTRRLTSLSIFPARTAWVAAGDDAIEPPLAADGNHVFAAGRSGSVRALDRLTGSPRWSQTGLPGVLSAADAMLVLRQEDGTVQALDPDSGQARWQASTGFAGRLPVTIAAGRVLVPGDGAIALDAASGKTLWSSPADAPAAAPAAVFGPWAFLSLEDGSLRCLDAATGVLLWSHETGAALHAAPVVDEKRRVLLGTSSRRVLSLRADARGEQRWRWKVGGDVRAAPVLHGENVLVVSYDAVLYALDRDNGHLAWRAPLPSRPISGPLLHGSAVLVACLEKDVVGFDARSGEQLGALAAPAAFQTPPLLVGDWLYMGLRDRSVVAMRLAQGAAAPAASEASPEPRRPRQRSKPSSPSPPAAPSPSPSPTPGALTTQDAPID
jgi:outer membrane protein assembly factor BamB